MLQVKTAAMQKHGIKTVETMLMLYVIMDPNLINVYSFVSNEEKLLI